MDRIKTSDQLGIAIAQLQSENVSARIEAVEMLSEVDWRVLFEARKADEANSGNVIRSSVIDALIKARDNEKNASVTAAILCALRFMAPSLVVTKTEHANKAMERLKSPDTGTRRDAIKDLMYANTALTSSKMPEIASIAATDTDEYVRQGCVEVIRLVVSGGSNISKEIVETIAKKARGDEHEFVRTRAQHTLANIIIYNREEGIVKLAAEALTQMSMSGIILDQEAIRDLQKASIGKNRSLISQVMAEYNALIDRVLSAKDIDSSTQDTLVHMLLNDNTAGRKERVTEKLVDMCESNVALSEKNVSALTNNMMTRKEGVRALTRMILSANERCSRRVNGHENKHLRPHVQQESGGARSAAVPARVAV